MKNPMKLLAIGAACSACLVVPAVIGAVGGTGIAAAGVSFASGWLTVDALLCVAVPLILVAGFAYFAMRAKKTTATECAADGNCGCKDTHSTT